MRDSLTSQFFFCWYLWLWNESLHMHGCTHAHIHTNIHTLTHTHTNIHTHTNKHTLTHTHSHTHAPMHVHIHTLTYTHTHAHTLTLTHSHTHTHMHAHTLTLIHTHRDRERKTETETETERQKQGCIPRQDLMKPRLVSNLQSSWLRFLCGITGMCHDAGQSCLEFERFLTFSVGENESVTVSLTPASVSWNMLSAWGLLAKGLMMFRCQCWPQAI